MKKEIASTIGEKLSIPSEAIANVPLLELRGRSSVCVENHRGITLYTDECIAVSVKRGTIRICGNHLTIYCMNHRRIEIRGSLQRIELE